MGIMTWPWTLLKLVGRPGLGPILDQVKRLRFWAFLETKARCGLGPLLVREE